MTCSLIAHSYILVAQVECRLWLVKFPSNPADLHMFLTVSVKLLTPIGQSSYHSPSGLQDFFVHKYNVEHFLLIGILQWYLKKTVTEHLALLSDGNIIIVLALIFLWQRHPWLFWFLFFSVQDVSFPLLEEVGELWVMSNWSQFSVFYTYSQCTMYTK